MRRETKIARAPRKDSRVLPFVLSFSTTAAFFSPPWSLLTEERDVLLLSLIPQRRVRIRFSRQIPCLQAAATSLFGINPLVLHPCSGTSYTRFSLSAQLLPTSVNDSRSYGFLSLINYHIAHGVCCDLERPFFSFPPPILHAWLFRAASRRAVSHRDGRKRRC